MSAGTIPTLATDVAAPSVHRPIPLLSTSMASPTITSMNLTQQYHSAALITVLLALHFSRTVAIVQPRLSRIKASVAQSLADEKARQDAFDAQQAEEAEAAALGTWYERPWYKEPLPRCAVRVRKEQASLRVFAAERIKEESAWLDILEEKLEEAVLDLVLMWKAGEGEVVA